MTLSLCQELSSIPLPRTLSIILSQSSEVYSEQARDTIKRKCSLPFGSQKQLGICSITLPVLCKIVVLVLHTLSLLTISLVTSTSASTKLLCLRAVMSSSRSVLIVDLFFAMIFALIAAIFSTDMASDKDLNEQKQQKRLNNSTNNSSERISE